LYLPKEPKGKAPAILYVCGHSKVIKDGISYGNKTHYQHHGSWFAQHGYVCLVIDTVQWGEFLGHHWGTYRENQWWWNARGYTPAGVETWNAMRALDYLESRPEVDPDKLGVTGRSGGGAYSWYLAALDDRVKVAVPVAGITTLQNHVVDGCVEGHCDCMYPVNTYRWDFPKLAALAAPRPLLLANTDRDRLFPLDGVLEVHRQMRRLYDQIDKPENLALQIAGGPHEDLQVLQLYALQWFDNYLKGNDRLIETAARPLFEPEQLKVFAELPADEVNTRIQESFVPRAPAPKLPSSQQEWQSMRSQWLAEIEQKAFGGWPESDTSSTPPRRIFGTEANGVELTQFEIDCQREFPLRLYLLQKAGTAGVKPKEIDLQPLDERGWRRFASAMRRDFGKAIDDAIEEAAQESKPWPSPLSEVTADQALAFFLPRGIGPTRWGGDAAKQTHVRRRFMLLGQTLDGMRVYDVRRAIQSLRRLDELRDAAITLRAGREMAGITLYAALLEPPVASLELENLADSHESGPDFLNVLRILDVPQTVAMVAEKSNVRLAESGDEAWSYPRAVTDKLGWADNFEIVNKANNTQSTASAR
jgi:dienelactone hydrolase